MKKALIILAVFLSACASVKFDGNEYALFVAVEVMADQTMRRCGNANDAKLQVAQLAAAAQYAKTYTQYREGRDDLYKAATELNSLTEEMLARYASSTPPSRGYCEEKAKNILQGTKLILSTVGRMQ